MTYLDGILSPMTIKQGLHNCNGGIYFTSGNFISFLKVS